MDSKKGGKFNLASSSGTIACMPVVAPEGKQVQITNKVLEWQVHRMVFVEALTFDVQNN